jgi:hypothetical protein
MFFNLEKSREFYDAIWTTYGSIVVGYSSASSLLGKFLFGEPNKKSGYSFSGMSMKF